MACYYLGLHEPLHHHHCKCFSDGEHDISASPRARYCFVYALGERHDPTDDKLVCAVIHFLVSCNNLQSIFLRLYGRPVAFFNRYSTGRTMTGNLRPVFSGGFSAEFRLHNLQNCIAYTKIIVLFAGST